MSALSPFGQVVLIAVVIVLVIHARSLSRRVSSLEHRRGRRNRR